MKILPPILYLLFLYSSALHAQVAVHGSVVDTKGQPVAGASISVMSTYDGATSNNLGAFYFKTSPKHMATIEVKAIGYKNESKLVDIAGDSIRLDFRLREQIEELTAVTVTAGAFEAGDKKRASTVLSSVDMLTTGASNADIVAAIRTLPGTQQLGEQEGLAVRGGTVYETKEFIDGTVVNNPYYTSIPGIAQRGRFSPTLFKGTIFTTGGYSAVYGQALSSALILESIDLPDQSTVDVSLSPLFVDAGLQRLAENKKSSWGVFASYANVGPYYQLIKQSVDYFTSPKIYSTHANFRIKTKSGGVLKFYTQASRSETGVGQENVDDETLTTNFDVRNTYWYNNLSYKGYIGSAWKLDIGSSFSSNHDEINQYLTTNEGRIPDNVNQSLTDSYVFGLDARQNLAQLKIVAEKRMANFNAIRFGGEYWYAFNTSAKDSLERKLIDRYSAIFAETDLHFSTKFALKLGARFEHSSIISSWNIAPRVSLAYKTGKTTQLSASYGLFYQTPELSELMYTTQLDYQRASHYLINFIQDSQKRKLRIEAFYKDYSSLVRTNPTFDNGGSGYAQGIELFWRDKQTFGSVDYWVSYSYLDSEREYLQYPEPLKPTFAARHTASLVAKRFFPSLSFGVNLSYTFASGRPYYAFQLDEASNTYHINGRGETINFNNLGLSANYLARWGKAFAVVFASVSNVLGQNQVFGYRFSQDGSRRLPIVPTAKRFYFVGVFLSWGIDRRQDIIDRNL